MAGGICGFVMGGERREKQGEKREAGGGSESEDINKIKKTT